MFADIEKIRQEQTTCPACEKTFDNNMGKRCGHAAVFCHELGQMVGFKCFVSLKRCVKVLHGANVGLDEFGRFLESRTGGIKGRWHDPKLAARREHDEARLAWVQKVDAIKESAVLCQVDPHCTHDFSIKRFIDGVDKVGCRYHASLALARDPRARKAPFRWMNINYLKRASDLTY
jgi:hypothetical protein